MQLRIVGLLVAVAAVCAGCGPSEGSAEWCKGVLEGKIQATEEQVNANDEKCGEALMRM
jgi:hypothetical protein